MASSDFVGKIWTNTPELECHRYATIISGNHAQFQLRVPLRHQANRNLIIDYPTFTLVYTGVDNVMNELIIQARPLQR